MSRGGNERAGDAVCVQYAGSCADTATGLRGVGGVEHIDETRLDAHQLVGIGRLDAASLVPHLVGAVLQK